MNYYVVGFCLTMVGSCAYAAQAENVQRQVVVRKEYAQLRDFIREGKEISWQTVRSSEVARMLINARADVNAPDADGKQPLEIIAKKLTCEPNVQKRRELNAIVALLQKNGAYISCD